MLKKHIILGWKVIIIVLIMAFVIGCGRSSSAKSVGVQFNNEATLEQQGFVTKLNQEINIGDEKVTFEKIAFDRNSMVFAYKGGTTPLSGDEFNIKGLEHTKEEKLTQQGTSPGFGQTVDNNGYHVVVVPHNLKLVNQKVSIELNINGRDNKFTVNFPGDIINSSTTEVMADSNGNVVRDTAKAFYRVVVGVGYTIVESKDDRDYLVEDEKRQRIQRSYKGSSTGAIAVYGPLPLPRREPSIKVYPAERLVVVSVK